jgi:hypothetical protein
MSISYTKNSHSVTDWYGCVVIGWNPAVRMIRNASLCSQTDLAFFDCVKRSIEKSTGRYKHGHNKDASMGTYVDVITNWYGCVVIGWNSAVRMIRNASLRS